MAYQRRTRPAVAAFVADGWSIGDWILADRWCAPRQIVARDGARLRLTGLSGRYLNRRIWRKRLPRDVRRVPEPQGRSMVRPYRRAA